MTKIAEFLGFNLWLLACTGISTGVFFVLARVIKAGQFAESTEGWLLWAICIPAFVATWYWVGSRSMRLIVAWYNRDDRRAH